MKWGPVLGAVVAGSTAALAFPTPGIVPLAFVAWAPLLVALEGATVAEGFALGATGGLAFFTIVVRWLAALSLPLWLILSAYLAVYVAVFAAIAVCLLQGPRAGRLAVPAAWVALEWLRGRLFGGFAWAELATALAPTPELLALARVGGVALLSLALFACNQAVAAAVLAASRGALREALRAAAVAIAVPVALALVAQATVPVTGNAGGPGLTVALIGGETDPRIVKGDDFGRALQGYVAKTDRALTTDPVDLVIWPETALPHPIEESGLAIHSHALHERIEQRWKAPLLFGVPVAAGDGGGRFWNEAQLWTADAVAHYQKQRLVPFGEYAPDLWFVGRLPRVLPGPEVAEGAGGAPFLVGGMSFGVLVCFEDLFSEDALERAAASDALVILTNDGWLGDAGAAQHLAAAILRALETGRWVARVANRGATVVIDPWGRTTAATLAPQRLEGGRDRTWYAMAPDLVPMVALAVTSAALVAGLFRRRTP